MFYRILFSVTAGVIAAKSVGALQKRESSPVQNLPGYREGKDVRNQSILKNQHWLFAALAFIPLILLEKTRETTLRLFWATMMEYLTTISIYCILLLLLLPVLRRVISSRVCGRLWEVPILMASVLIYFEAIQLSSWVRLPNLVIYIPKTILTILIAVWLTGFTVSLFWYIFNHFRFKKRLRQNAIPVSGETLRIWGQELAKVGLEQTTPLSITPDLQTPLVVGVRKNALEAYLPDKSYTEEELRLIFQHELRHIFRRDAEIKLAWMVIRSLLWFNPLAWISTQKAAEDLELSCDEFVLTDADETTRRRYAELLLDAAGDGRGFSTCLSSKAKTLRYRLKCVVQPGKRITGSLVLAALVFVFVLSCGTISFAHQKGTVEELQQIKRFSEMQNSSYRINERSRGTLHTKEKGFFDQKYRESLLFPYVSSLEVTALTKPLSDFEESGFGEGECAFFWLRDPVSGERQRIIIWQDWLIVGQSYYKVQNGIDWELLRSMVVLKEY